MSVQFDSANRPSEDVTDASNINSTDLVADELYSLLDEVDSESIADEFKIGLHSDKHDFTNHVKTVVREGLDPSSSLAELEDKTIVDDSLEHMPKSRFSELTNDRDYRAVVRLLFELLHTPQLYHQRGVQRKRLGWMTRGVVAVDATNLELTRSVVVSDEFVGDDEDIYEIDTDGGGVELHCAARVDGKHKHPLGATVTEGDTHESPQFDLLEDDVEVFADLDSVIWTFDRAYTRYLRFCEIKHSDNDFVTLMYSDARFELIETLEEFEVSITPERGAQPRDSADESTRQVRDERIELAETGEEFRRIVLNAPDGEEIEYLTTLASSAYDPIDVISIYTLRTCIEILFRELKQYLNIENFHSKSLNGVLFELFCALIGYVLVEWFRQCHPVKGGMARAIQQVRTFWNKTLDTFG
ncbi:IS4-like element ISHwa9 family transposase [Haloquadratum walsbyi]|uniref:ISH8-type transposase ISHwa9 n=2 Tax=Haloquadratum walsbyi TaxID=293091 RepID=G0LGJ5_HALWC|nr:IS4-like element ISHwa9 family transposase [Haloquadratum walsbyi]CCC39215.1 ISH8-type transposase ISHwa9 [Haloquadratum walsbyi C23]CCC40666.1 ISH8-type transposase ISHwa9 [Haloquadratum walsbyi C23]